jgi:hypothetical protein
MTDSQRCSAAATEAAGETGLTIVRHLRPMKVSVPGADALVEQNQAKDGGMSVS